MSAKLVLLLFSASSMLVVQAGLFIQSDEVDNQFSTTPPELPVINVENDVDPQMDGLPIQEMSQLSPGTDSDGIFKAAKMKKIGKLRIRKRTTGCYSCKYGGGGGSYPSGGGSYGSGGVYSIVPVAVVNYPSGVGKSWSSGGCGAGGCGQGYGGHSGGGGGGCNGGGCSVPNSGYGQSGGGCSGGNCGSSGGFYPSGGGNYYGSGGPSGGSGYSKPGYGGGGSCSTCSGNGGGSGSFSQSSASASASASSHSYSGSW